MLNYYSKDFFTTYSSVLVNPVNTVGIMGAGLALQFKKNFPHNFNAYQAYCRLKKLKPGELFCYQEDSKLIINLATKDDWRNPSRIEWIKTGLSNLDNFIQGKNLKAIALTPLGCGLGGLNQQDVIPLIQQLADKHSNTEFCLYGANR